jgi:hypothetical protein
MPTALEDRGEASLLTEKNVGYGGGARRLDGRVCEYHILFGKEKQGFFLGNGGSERFVIVYFCFWLVVILRLVFLVRKS